MQHPVSILNPRAAHPDQRTLVVFGLYRGGTSMLAGLARILGVFMGSRISGPNNEDLDLQMLDPARLRAAIGARNAAHDIWGWKDPGLFHTLPECYQSLRNPYFVISFRDVLAASQTQVNGGFYPDLIGAMRAAQGHTGQILDFVARVADEGLPVMLASYERSLGRKDLVVADLARFFGVPLDDDTRRRAAAFIDAERGYGAPEGMDDAP